MTRIWSAALAAALACGAPAAAQGGAAVAGRVVEAGTGTPIRGAAVEVAQPALRARSDPAGRFLLEGLAPGATATVRATAPGFAPYDTTLVLRGARTLLVIPLRPRIVALDPLTVRAETHGAQAERTLYEQEVVPGLVGVSGQELRHVPALAETDVLRALQALPGVVTLNDLSAELHVRGGGPDQNLFLLDGARVFAPHHLFGLFGAFNPDAIARAEFFRGAFPARYGGALSSVVELEQRQGSEERVRADGGVGLLGARVAAAGALPWKDGRWMLAGRRTHADVALERIAGDTFPYAFYDLQGRVSVAPGARHRVHASFFGSSDRYRMFFGGGSDDLRTRWKNGVASLGWDWAGPGGTQAGATAWHSRYSGTLVSGSGPEAPATDNRLALSGLRAELRRSGERGGVRAGFEVEAGTVRLVGDDSAGAYVTGRTEQDHRLPSAWVEGERRWNRLRLTPGLRVTHDGRDGGGLLVEPRLAARLHLSDDLAVTVGVGRAHQVLVALRDDRFALPGPPLWLRLPDGASASRTDGVSAALEGWRGGAWSYRAEAYARRFDGVARWRPEGSRQIASLAYDRGHAEGVELFVRRHEGRLTGWASYSFSRAAMRDASTGAEYAPAWDRRHGAEATLAYQATRNLTLSARSSYGSGLPFWPFAGYVNAPRLVPQLGRTKETRRVPVWGDTQMRYPAYFRADVAVRGSFRFGRVGVEPVLSVQNVTARQNVLYYRLESEGPTFQEGRRTQLVPITPFPIPVVPSLGIDVHF